MALRPATADDYEAITGLPAPGEWFGLVEAKPHLVEGIGLVYRDVEGAWWVTFKRCPFVRKIKTAHAGAKQLLQMARDRGLVVHAIPDPEVDGADRWMVRLGFRRTERTIGGLAVWDRK